MPLRDHFHPSPTRRRDSGTQLHSMWPALLVQQLFTILPARYQAEAGVRLGTAYEVDVATLDKQWNTETAPDSDQNSGGVAVAPRITTPATYTVDAELLDPDEFELKVYDTEDGWRLVAAVEFVSPSNKDRPDARDAFVSKCAELLRRGVSVAIVDLVTTRQFNLYASVTAEFGAPDPQMSGVSLYAASLRGVRQPDRRIFRLESWAYPLQLGQPLPSVPLWLSETERFELPLESSYEEACRYLRLPPP